MQYDMLEPLSDLNASLDLLTGVFAPIYTEHWVKDEAPLRGNPPFDMNVNAFAQMWFAKTLRIFMAYEDKRAAGYIIGLVFRPLPYQASVFQVEDWYARENNREVVKGLFDYLETGLKFMGIDELWISHNERMALPPVSHLWQRRGATIIDRYGK